MFIVCLQWQWTFEIVARSLEKLSGFYQPRARWIVVSGFDTPPHRPDTRSALSSQASLSMADFCLHEMVWRGIAMVAERILHLFQGKFCAYDLVIVLGRSVIMDVVPVA